MTATDVLNLKSKDVEEIFANARVGEPVWGYIWYFAGLPIIITLASYIVWTQLGIEYQALPMVGFIASLYIGIWANQYHSDNYRSYQAIGLSTFYTTLGYLLIFSILAIFRLYYSRSFLFSSYILTLVWTIIGMIFFRRRHQCYLVIKGGIADRLKVLSKDGWKFITNYKETKNSVGFDGIVVDLHAHDNNRMLKALADSSLHGVPVLHAATVLERYSGRTNLRYIAHEGLYKLLKNKYYPIFKNFWELMLIFLLLPLILPVMLITALAIKLDSEGPVLFKQDRVGKEGKFFVLYKFRSMRINSEISGSKFADEDDERITKLGKFIRKFRIDELPQFWNVIKGDMSLVGPRPEQEEFVTRFDREIPFYSYRHKVRPGITGWAQVRDGYAASLESTRKKLEYDLYYVKNLSLSLDLLIVYATIKTVLTGFGSR